MVAQAIQKQDKLTILANTVQSSAQVISEHLKKTGLPQPSFDANAPQTLFPPDTTDRTVLNAQHELLSAAEMLRALAHGPAEYLTYHLFQYLEIIAFRYVYRYKIASFVPLASPEAPPGTEVPTISYDELAAKASAAGYPVATSDLKRMVRTCASSMIFCEPVPGRVAHTASSARMITAQMNDLVGLGIEEAFPAVEKAIDAIEKYGPAAQEPSQSAYGLAYNTKGKDFYTYLTDEGGPERVARFSRAMKAINDNAGYGTQNVADAYDWASLGKAKLVDVGGSRGHNSMTIAQKNPEMTFVVQDLESVIKEANATVVPSLPSNLAGKVSFQAYDFFGEPQPVHDADVYFLSLILHNWADKYATKILKSIVKAMKPGARIFILDGVLPSPGTIPIAQDRALRSMDLAMMVLNNARERDAEDWEALFKQADPRLKLETVSALPGSILSLMSLSLKA
ncbi:O-methyltransferase-domain-containing protein [Phyllosticta capitalensis]